MNIVVDLGNQLIAEAVCQLLLKLGDATVILRGKPPANGSTPDVLLLDSATLTHDLLTRYPNAKVLLMDTGIEKEKLYATLLSHRIHGVLSPAIDLHLLKKALTAVSEGQIWIDHGSVKALLHGLGGISQKGKISHITGRQQEIIECVCQGLSNKEIAQRLALSEHTVKAHLNSVFRRLNVTSRSKLIALATHRQREVSV